MRFQLTLLIAAFMVISSTVAPQSEVTPGSGTAGVLSPPTTTSLGTIGGIPWVQHDGIFAGTTSTGAFRVPYRITAPADTSRGSGTVVVEPPHWVTGLATLDMFLGRDLLLGSGISHAGVGYSTTASEDGNSRILDANVSGVFIEGGFPDEGGRTDDEIIVAFGRTLTTDPEARTMIGTVSRRYLTGFSDSSLPVMRLVASGQASSDFDLVFAFLAEGDPQAALSDGRYTGKVVVTNSEFEGASADLVDRGTSPDAYRFYAVSGSPHIDDPLVPFFTNSTTPASIVPELRAHFVQADRWMTSGAPPAASTHLATTDGHLARDSVGNAGAVDSSGASVPRLPFVELGEARFGTGFIGTYGMVRTQKDLGYLSEEAYTTAFDASLAAYVDAFGILAPEADAMHLRAGLCAGLTYTETYRDHYDAFTSLEDCPAP